MPSADELVDLLAVPVAGVGEHDLGRVGDAGGGELGSVAAIIGPSCPKSGELTETSAAITICSLVADGLGVVALHPAARRLDVARVRVGHVDLARRLLGRRDRAWAARRTAGRPSSARAPGRPRRRRWRDPRSRAPRPVGAWPREPAPAASLRDRPGLRVALRIERRLAASQPLRRPCALASSGGSSSPRRSPNCSSSSASISAASCRISSASCL